MSGDRVCCILCPGPLRIRSSVPLWTSQVRGRKMSFFSLSCRMPDWYKVCLRVTDTHLNSASAAWLLACIQELLCNTSKKLCKNGESQGQRFSSVLQPNSSSQHGFVLISDGTSILWGFHLMLFNAGIVYTIPTTSSPVIFQSFHHGRSGLVKYNFSNTSERWLIYRKDGLDYD